MTDASIIGPERGAEPPPDLVAHWSGEAGILPAGAGWAPLHGGRTNASWRVSGGGGAFVVKLFRPGSGTPLFPNDPEAEAAALTALTDTGLAPRLLAKAITPAGASVVYAHVAGRGWRPGDDPADVARALARLHREPAPPVLPEASSEPAALRAQALGMLAGLGEAGAALAAREPTPAAGLPAVRPVFLHGDATASNTLVTPGGITFIDWQCPARGDPGLDLAIFLSPAMQTVSGNRPLTATETARFLSAYRDETVAARYRALAPLFHWRMAAYCLWRAARGDEGYREAAALELAQL